MIADAELIERLKGFTTDEDRVGFLDQLISDQNQVVLGLQGQLALEEGRIEGLRRLRERIGAPTLSPKHTLRSRIMRYLEAHPDSGTSEIATGLCAPVTTISMTLGRNKDLFEKTTNGWSNRK